MMNADSNAAHDAALAELRWAMDTSRNQFSLILAHCNFVAIRERLLARVQEETEVRIIPYVGGKGLFHSIFSAVDQNQPVPVMVVGLETAPAPGQTFSTANQVREEFRKTFKFPVILWMTDELITSLLREAPDLKSWAKTVRFVPSHSELRVLSQNCVRLYVHAILEKDEVFDWLRFGDSRRHELKAILKEMEKKRNPEPSELPDDFYFLNGIELLRDGRMADAIPNLKRSMASLQGGENPEKYGALRFCLSMAISENGDPEKALVVLQAAVDQFSAIGLLYLAAKLMTEQCRLLWKLENWSALGETAEKALAICWEHGLHGLGARNHFYLAVWALRQENWRKAVQSGRDALAELAKIGPSADIARHDKVRDHARLIMAKAHLSMNSPNEAIELLKSAREEGDYAADPELYTQILELLRKALYQKGEYLPALEAKQEKHSLEHEFGLRAFVGPGRIQAARRIRKSEGEIASEIQASGRREDLDRIIGKIQRNDSRLLIVYGLSGVGKSSLIEAGVVPTLKTMNIECRQVLPVVIRNYNDWTGNLLQAIKEALGESSTNPDAKGMESPKARTQKGDILDQLRDNDRRDLLTVLIFDQFEEFFFANSDSRPKKTFSGFIDDCLDIGYTKVILSLRRDYIDHLLDIPQHIRHRRSEKGQLDTVSVVDDILNKNIIHGLENFSSDQAKAVIKALTERTQFRPTDDVIRKLVNELAAKTGEIRPIELQIAGSRLETEKISGLDQYKFAKLLLQGFLDEAIHDCGAENEETARLLLFLLTNAKSTRPLKTLMELQGDIKQFEIVIESCDVEQIIEVLLKTGLILLVPEQPENRYQVVHDYLAELIRENAKPLLLELDERKAKKVIEKRLASENEKREKEQAIKEQERQRKLLKISFAVGIAFAFLAILSAWFGFQSERDKRIAIEQEKIAQKQTQIASSNLAVAEEQKQIAQEQTQIANYNLALAYEEKAGLLIQNAQNSKDSADYQKAWLFTLEALKQDIGQRYLPISLGNLFNPKLRSGINPWIWSPPSISPHSSRINSVSFSPDGKHFATGSSDNTARLWNVKTGQLAAVLEGHSGSVNSVSFSPDGKNLATGSSDNTARLWSVNTGQLLTTLEGHSRSVNSVSFSPDGKYLSTGSSDNMARLWHVETGQLRAEFEGHSYSISSVSFSPNGKMLATGSRDRTARLWNLETGHTITEIRERSGGILSVSFSSDGKLLATGTSGNVARLWDVKTGQPMTEFLGHTNSVNSVSLSPDGELLASGSGDTTVRLWDVKSGEVVREIQGDSAINSISFNPNGKELVAGSSDSRVRLWDWETGQSLTEYPWHSGNVSCFSFSPDGKLLATGSYDNTARLWDLKTGRSIMEFRGHSQTINSITFSPNGKLLATGSSDKTVRLWNVKSGQALIEYRWYSSSVNSISFSSDGKFLATGSNDQTVRIWDVESNQIVGEFLGHSGGVYFVQFGPNGKNLATSSNEGTIRSWNLETHRIAIEVRGIRFDDTKTAFSPNGKYVAIPSPETSETVATLWDVEKGEIVREFGRYGRAVHTVAFSPSGEVLATGIGDEVWYWEVKSGQFLTRYSGNGGSINSLSFSPDGSLMATLSDFPSRNGLLIWDWDETQIFIENRRHRSADNSISLSPDGKHLLTGSHQNVALLWDVETSQIVNEFAGHFRPVESVSFSPDGKLIATGSGDQTARVWDLETGQTLSEFRGHSGPVNSVSFSPDGKMLSTGSSDNTARVWDLETGQTVTEFQGHSRSVNSVSFSPDGKMLATGSSDNTARVWDLETGQTVTEFQGHSLSVNSVSFNPGGNLLATGSSDNTARLWDLDTGQTVIEFQGLNSSVYCASFSPDGKLFAIGSGVKPLQLWDLEAGQKVTDYRGQKGVREVSFSKYGKFLASISYDTAQVWEVKTGQSLIDLQPTFSGVLDLSFSPNGEYFAIASENNAARLFYAESLQIVAKLKGHSGWIKSVSFSPDGGYLATGSNDSTARVWEVETGQTIFVFRGHSDTVNSVSFSPGGQWLASGSDDDTLRLWDLKTGKTLIEYLGHSQNVNSLSFSPGGKLLASGSDDGTVRLWEVETGRTLNELHAHSGSILAVRFSPSGKYLATGSGSGKVLLWGVETGQIVKEFEGDPRRGISSLSFSIDGRFLASGSTGKMKIWDLETETTVVARDRLFYRNIVSFSPDGKYFASNSRGFFKDKSPIQLFRLDDIFSFINKNFNSKKIKDLYLFSSKLRFRIEGLKAVEQEDQEKMEYIPIKGSYQSWNTIQAPRPPFIDAVEWYLASPLEKGLALSSDGRIMAAIIEFEKALDLDPLLNFNPQAKAMEIGMPILINKALELAKNGQVKQSLAEFDRLKEFSPNLKVPAPTLIALCRQASLHGYAAEVLEKCLLAVERASESDLPSAKDGLGMAQAFLGNSNEAVENFRFFIKKNSDPRDYNLRKKWIEILENGETLRLEEVREDLKIKQAGM